MMGKVLDLFKRANAKVFPKDISIFHEFHRPPYGGGNQFLLALQKEFQGKGYKVEHNTISPSSRACLYNSFNFDFDLLRRLKRADCRMVHRVDGPVTVYRGREDGTDRRIWEINRELADATIFQSNYSMKKHLELGLEFNRPLVIMNAVDGRIFNRIGREEFSAQRKIRLVSSSWSTNPNKGAEIYRWLDDNLDFNRFEYTFCGRIDIPLHNIRLIPAIPSKELASYLKMQDVYITASKHDPCSNALLEALACGLPAIFLNSGGHPEIVGQGGLTFENAEEIPALLERLLQGYAQFQEAIRVPSIADTAQNYLEVMGLE